MPTCGTWLISENNSGIAGAYELNKGIVNMTCEFSSLPEPAIVSWVHKAVNTNSWKTFPCSTKNEEKICGSSEHRVISRCVLRATDLNMSGSYRCQASNNNPIVTENHKAYGSEFDISVVGISSVKVINYTLKQKQLGNIIIEVCANPKPEVYWLSSESIVTSHTGTDRLIVAHLHHQKTRLDASGPASVVPYCYLSELYIRNVEPDDQDIKVLVKTENSMEIRHLSLRVSGSSKFGFGSIFQILGLLMLIMI
ncbi:unnamed protein product [Auanema sp. JU1783]|nr:unnamed protein product [Auanema sp. JU1783]